MYPFTKNKLEKKNCLYWSATVLVSYTGSRPLFTLRIVAVRSKQLARDKKSGF